MDQMIKSNVKGVTRRENPANNYHLTQQPPAPPRQLHGAFLQSFNSLFWFYDPELYCFIVLWSTSIPDAADSEHMRYKLPAQDCPDKDSESGTQRSN